MATSAGGTTDGQISSFTTTQQVTTSFANLTGGSISYGTGSVNLSGQLVTTPSTPFPTGSVVTVSINGVAETATLNANGSFQLVYQFSTPLSVGESPYAITYAYTSPDGSFTAASDVSQSLIVTPATPSVTVSPVNLTYGTPLANTQLSGTFNGSPVTTQGTFTYTTAAGTLLYAGNGQTESVTFMPTDTTDYTPATTSVTVNVAQATPSVSVSDPGGTYDGSTFPATATVTGVVPNLDNMPAASLEGVTPILAYYHAGTTAGGKPLPGRRRASGLTRW